MASSKSCGGASARGARQHEVPLPQRAPALGRAHLHILDDGRLLLGREQRRRPAGDLERLRHIHVVLWCLRARH
eukprot:270752-Prymnesium_polylepis.1